MLFLNTALLLGAIGIAIPIVIHLLNRRSSRIVDWGAMNFLLESLAIRNRRIRLEEALLMATRCLLVGLLALALARPFIPPGSTVPWLLVLPLALLGIVGLGVATVLHDEKKWQRRIAILSVLLLLACIGLVVFQKYLNLSRFALGSRQDVALIIDGSTSMSISVEGESNFDRAVEEARTLIKRAPRGHAFSLIVGGPSPSAKILDPTTDRAALETALDDLVPLDGAMTTYQALTLASLSLARGDHPAKQIVLLTDEQNVGWEIGKSGRWNFLADAFRNLPSEPQIMIRKMPLPNHIRNVAVKDIALSREIVGVDRPVEISVTVENTGNESVTPEALVLSTENGKEVRDESLGQLKPGEEQVVHFFYQFSDPGAHAFSVALEVTDDIAKDNTGYSALNVASELKTLIVDGRPSGRPFERASAFAAVALAPSSLTLDPTLEANIPGTSDEESDDFNMHYDPTLDPIDFLVEPRVVELPDIASIHDFSSYDAIILADVPKLPAATATAISDYVDDGGGLMIAAGSRIDPNFYNGWKLEDGSPLLPATVGAQNAASSLKDAFSPSTRTLSHPALSKVADPTKSDFSTTLITNYRKQQIPENLSSDSSVGARLNNGDILLSSRNAGEGHVDLLGIPLDLSSGNLVTRQAFLPFLHEMVYYLANPAAYHLNLDPGWEVTIGLTGNRGRAIGQGLIGHYYASATADKPAYSRQDESIQFNWLNGNPAPGIPANDFRVEWTGKIQFPETDRYAISAEVDDGIDVWIDGKQIASFRYPGGKKRIGEKFEGGRWYDFRAVMHESGGDARAVLLWESNDIPLQPIPSEAFRSFSDEEAKTGRTSTLTTYDVTGPDGRLRTAQLSSTDRGSILKLQGEISSGLYRLSVPREQAPFFSTFLPKDKLEIPFTVKRDPAESHLTELTESDFAFMQNFVTLAQPQTLEELIGFLNGNQFGQELWKYLALGAFAFLLIEILLSRWIARSRKMGEEILIKFESKDAPTSEFHEQLTKFGKSSAQSAG